MVFELPTLGFEYSALEPYIDRKTMEVHHRKHHAGYLQKFNEAIFDTALETKTLTDIFAAVSTYPESIRNNGGGVFNHAFFWEIITPSASGLIEIRLADAITKYFGTIDKMKEEFSSVAASYFGSGWAWLVKRDDGELLLTTTANQDNPFMDIAAIQGSPILCLDLWEHAYYLRYQNRRFDYIQAFWHIVNWDHVARLYNET